LWLIGLLLLTLADEYRTEGYIFNWQDLFKLYLTHEHIALCLALALALLMGKSLYTKTHKV